MKIRNILIKFGLLDFKIGDKVTPNPKVFLKGFQFIEGKDYSTILEVGTSLIYLEGRNIPYLKNEINLF